MQKPRATRAFATTGALVACMLWPLTGARAQPAPPTVATRALSGQETTTILGRDVVNSMGEDVGPLIDVLVDPAGHPIAGVIDIGGFFGVGRRRVAVAWHLLHFMSDSGEPNIHMDLTFDWRPRRRSFRARTTP